MRNPDGKLTPLPALAPKTGNHREPGVQGTAGDSRPTWHARRIRTRRSLTPRDVTRRPGPTRRGPTRRGRPPNARDDPACVRRHRRSCRILNPARPRANASSLADRICPLTTSGARAQHSSVALRTRSSAFVCRARGKLASKNFACAILAKGDSCARANAFLEWKRSRIAGMTDVALWREVFLGRSLAGRRKFLRKFPRRPGIHG